MFLIVRDLIKNERKIPANRIKMLFIKADLKKLKDDMRNMSENEIKNKGLDVLANFVEEVFIGNTINDMPPLKTKKAKQRPSTRSKQAKKHVEKVEKLLKD